MSGGSVLPEDLAKLALHIKNAKTLTYVEVVDFLLPLAQHRREEIEALRQEISELKIQLAGARVDLELQQKEQTEITMDNSNHPVLKREEVYALIDGERAYQDKAWSENNMGGDHPLRIGEDLLLIERYLRSAIDMWTSEKRPEVQTMALIRKIGAIAVRSMETNGAPPR
jgi:hypothetical protein